jgi:hypothetical protein
MIMVLYSKPLARIEADKFIAVTIGIWSRGTKGKIGHVAGLPGRSLTTSSIYPAIQDS